MNNDYWKEYWDSYYSFMDFYINELQKIYPDEEIEERYVEVAKLFEPSVRPSGYIPPFIQPGGGPVIIPIPPFIQPGWPGGPGPVIQPPGQSQPQISPGGGQFTINNCKKVSIVRIVMRSGFNPSNFYMVVESSDRISIQGYRISCNDGRIRFVPMSVEYRNINFIECVF